MSQIRNIVVSIIALIILFFIMQQASKIGELNFFFTLVTALIVVLILWNVARRLIKGY
jgi:chromate transport protein ChrA